VAVAAGEASDTADHRRKDEYADEHNDADPPRPLSGDDLCPRSARDGGCLQIE
jgi:hypothetical protein